MYELNLPTPVLRLAGTAEKPTVFDILRRKYVDLTPEEWVRQHFVHYLIEHKNFPQELLANEVALQVGDKTLRADSVLYGRDLHPRVIVEYKAPTVAITQKVFDQITIYNFLMRVDYLIVSNGLNHYCCKMDYDNQKYLFIEEIPDYKNL